MLIFAYDPIQELLDCSYKARPLNFLVLTLSQNTPAESVRFESFA